MNMCRDPGVTQVTVAHGSVVNPSTSVRGRYAERPIGIKPVMNHNHPLRRLGALALIAVAALSFTAGCSGDDEAPAGNAAAAAAGGPEPKTIDGAKTAAQTVFDRFSGGDFAGAWEMYTAKGKQAISKEDYVKLNTACSRKGLAIQPVVETVQIGLLGTEVGIAARVDRPVPRIGGRT